MLDAPADLFRNITSASHSGEAVARVIHQLWEYLAIFAGSIATHRQGKAQPLLKCPDTVLIVHFPPVERLAILGRLLLPDESLDLGDEILEKGNARLAFVLKILDRVPRLSADVQSKAA